MIESRYRFSLQPAHLLGVNDDQRMVKAAKGIVGKRLTYRRTRGTKEAEETIPF